MNGKKTLVAVIAAILCMGTGAYALSINWGFDQKGFTDSGGVNGLPLGDLVGIGTFGTLTDLQIGALTTPSAVWAAFSSYATGAIGDGNNAPPDPLGILAEPSTGAAGAGFFTKTIYVVAFNNADPNSATGMWVGKGPEPDWVFPADDNGNIFIGGNLFTSASVLIGGYSPGTFNNLFQEGTFDALTLTGTVIPEPSTMMLVGTGLLGLLAIRRRRS